MSIEEDCEASTEFVAPAEEGTFFRAADWRPDRCSFSKWRERSGNTDRDRIPGDAGHGADPPVHLSPYFEARGPFRADYGLPDRRQGADGTSPDLGAAQRSHPLGTA